MSTPVFAFGDRATLERVLGLAGKGADLSSGSRFVSEADIIWAEVTEKISDTEAKCKQVVRNSDGSTEDYTGGLIWDSDESQSPLNALPNLKCFEGYSFPDVGGVVEALYLALDDTPEWYGFPPASSGGLAYVEITGSSDANTYTGTIYDNPVDRNVVEAGVTIKAIKHEAGVIPNSTAGKGKFATKSGGVYYLVDYSVAE